MSNIINSISEPLIDNSFVSNNTKETTKQLEETLQKEYNKYSKYKLLLEGVKQCLNNDGLDETIKTKINIIIQSVNSAQTCNIDSMNLLGLTSKSPELSYIESQKLKAILDMELDGQYKNICDEYHEITHKSINQITNIESDKTLLEFRQQLTKEQELYVNNLKEQQEILMEIVNLRLKQLPKVTEQKQRECQIKLTINQLKSIIAHQKLRVNIFMETTNSLSAYKELIKDIMEQQQEIQREIEDLRNLKKKYRQVSCKQFDDILKNFIQYKTSIEKKKLLFEAMRT